MLRSPVIGVLFPLLLWSCGSSGAGGEVLLDGGTSDAGQPSDAGEHSQDAAPELSFADLETAWELQVGSSGDAVLDHVEMLSDGKLLAISSAPAWVTKVLAEGSLDTDFGEANPINSDAKLGWLDLPADDLWLADAEHAIVSVGKPAVRTIRGILTSDGAPNLAFGADGSVTLPYSSATDGEQAVAIDHDDAQSRFAALVVREWQMRPGSNGSLPTRIGPSLVEVLEIDALTGAVSSAGTHVLPEWTGKQFPSRDQAQVRALFAQPDGSYLALVTETVDGQTDVRPNNIGTRWSTVRLVSGTSPAFQTIAMGEYNPAIAGVARLDDAGFDLYLTGAFEGVSASPQDPKLMRFSVGPLGAEVTTEVLGAGIDLSTGPSQCNASVATSTYLLYGRTADKADPIAFTAYPKSGAPVDFTSDIAQRCITSLSVGTAGTVFAGTWDTTEVAWRALITALVP